MIRTRRRRSRYAGGLEAQGHWAEEESAAFLKKRGKKLLLNWGLRRRRGQNPQSMKVFCALFFNIALLSSASHVARWPCLDANEFLSPR
jgi:hypothetical protein